MFDKEKHRAVLVRILKEIYSHPKLRNILGFKGGTAAFLFYDLPRLSVDLDFNLLQVKKRDFVFTIMPTILSQFGQVIEKTDKKNTLFFLLSYRKGSTKVKVEISKRPSRASFEVKNYLGIPVLIMKKEDIVAEKLSALLTRKKFAARDLFDLWFFLKDDWPINDKIIKQRTKLNLMQALKAAISKAEKVKPNMLLQGLGELLEEKQKVWVKNKLKQELIFHLKLYLKSTTSN